MIRHQAEVRRIDSREMLFELVGSGEIEATDYVRTLPDEPWIRVQDHVELRDFFDDGELITRDPLSAPLTSVSVAAADPPNIVNADAVLAALRHEPSASDRRPTLDPGSDDVTAMKPAPGPGPSEIVSLNEIDPLMGGDTAAFTSERAADMVEAARRIAMGGEAPRAPADELIEVGPTSEFGVAQMSAMNEETRLKGEANVQSALHHLPDSGGEGVDFSPSLAFQVHDHVPTMSVARPKMPKPRPRPAELRIGEAEPTAVHHKPTKVMRPEPDASSSSGNKTLIFVGIAVLAAGLLIGIGLAIVSGGGEEDVAEKPVAEAENEKPDPATEPAPDETESGDSSDGSDEVDGDFVMDDVDDAPDEEPEEQPVVDVSTIAATPWVVGSRWIYLYERTALEDGPDEAGQAMYHISREVIAVEAVFPLDTDPEAEDPEPSAHIVSIEERGGPSDKKVRRVRYRITDRCVEPMVVPSWEDFTACLEDSPTGEERDVAGSTATVVQLGSDGGRSRTLAPAIGLAELSSRDRLGRPVSLTLVGYRVGDATSGNHDLEPAICDWTHSLKPRKGTVSFELSSAHGFRTLTGATSKTESTVTIETLVEGGEDISLTRDMPLMRAKSWLPADEHAEYVLLHYQSVTGVRFEILRLAEMAYESTVFELEAAAANTKIGSLLTASPESCFVRLRRKTGSATRVKDVGLRPEGVVVFGSGTLASN